jgi:hypothetical protein
MQVVNVILDVDANPLSKIIRIQNGITFSRLPQGTASGKSSIGISAHMPDGRHVLLEVTMQNFEAVAAAFRGAEERARQCDGRN